MALARWISLRTHAMEGMIMDCRTYQAFSMADALAAVKRDLGDDAVILNTRSFRRGALFGLGGQNIIEVTATRAENARSTMQRKPVRAVKATAAPDAGSTSQAASQRSGTSIALQLLERTQQQNGSAFNSIESDRERTRALARTILQRQEQAAAAHHPLGRSTASTTRNHPVAPKIEASVSQPIVEPRPTLVSSALEVKPLPVAQRFILATAPEAESQCGNAPIHAVEAPASQPANVDVPMQAGPERGAMQEELSAIRRMVSEVLQHQVRSGQAPLAMPQQLFDMYLSLIGQEVEEELAGAIVQEVQAELDEESLNDPAVVRIAVLQRLAAHIPVGVEACMPEEVESLDGRPYTIALVGPTGVGKTTTLAKLAATYKLHHNQSIGVITADTYRIAAVDQLRTYTDIIGLQLEVVLTPGEMRDAVNRLSNCDRLLIDTAGRSQNDACRLEELKEFIAAASPHEVHLVLSATAGEKVLMQEAEAFASVGVDKIVLTKLDEAVSFGVLVNVVRTLGKQLSFFTTGQEVPDHIEPAGPRRLAELVLGGKVHA